ncbi:MAG: hypothetical protein ACXV1K_04620, partial [Kineosporiaceae bacterium]
MPSTSSGCSRSSTPPWLFALAEAEHERAWLGWLILALLAGWSVLVAVWRRRTPPGPGLLAVDLAVACA